MALKKRTLMIERVGRLVKINGHQFNNKLPKWAENLPYNYTGKVIVRGDELLGYQQHWKNKNGRK